MPTNLYGPGDNFDLETSHVLPALIRKFVEAAESDASQIVAWGTGSPRREFLHVDDLAEAVVCAIERYDDDRILNVGTGVDISIKELAELVSRLAGYQGEIIWDTGRPDGTPRKVMDVSRLKEIDWEPRISLDDGIQKTLDWYRETRAKGSNR